MALDAPIKKFLKIIPNTWDDIKFMEGYPGKQMLIARRKVNDWFVACVNCEAVEKKLVVDLSFLPKGNYSLQLIKDGDNNQQIKTDIMQYANGKPIPVRVLPNGGFTVWIKKVL